MTTLCLATTRFETGSRVTRCLAILCLLFAAPFAWAAPRIGIVTMQPGADYWARFGHNAVLVDARADGGEAMLYNYGFFDFAEPGFLARFLQGKMEYMLVALPMDEDLANYTQAGRGVGLQWLDVEPAAAQELARFLEWNARPENARYRYDYFTDNCSTKVRDALDRALGGALKPQLSGRSQGLTYRSEALRLGAPLKWMALGMHFGLGPYADRPLSRWDEGFVPMRLRDALREARTAAGTPLVLSEHELLPQRIAPERAQTPRWLWAFLGVGLGLAAAIVFFARRAPRAVALFALVLWIACGLTGLGLAALWAFTDHVAAWGNENVLLACPLCLGLLPGGIALARGRAPGRLFGPLLLAVALLAGVAGFLKFLPFRIQDNLDWIALLLPVHVALAWALRRRQEATL